MFYEGPIYRPPSEAHSLLIQATVGCPHNKCTFCMVYKKGPAYRVRSVENITRDMDEALQEYGSHICTLFFFPAGNTIAMETEDLAAICRYAHRIFPRLEQVTVYGSSQYIYKVVASPDPKRPVSGPESPRNAFRDAVHHRKS